MNGLKLVLSIVLLIFLYNYLSIRDIVIYTNLHCLEDFKQGVPLYSGFWCTQGFFTYLFMLPIYLVFKGGLLSALKAITVLYSIGMYMLIIKMMNKVNLNYILLALLYFFVFYHAEWSIDFILAQSAFFFTLSYYTLFYTKWKHRLILASVFTTISIYTKTNVITLVPILLIDIYRRNKSLKEVIKFSAIPSLTIIILILIFPNYVMYTIGSGTSQISNNPSDLINAYLKPNIIAVYIMFLFALSLYLIVKKRMFWPLYLLTNIAAFGGVLWEGNLAVNTIPYLLPTTSFLMLSLNRWAESSKKVYFVILMILYFSVVKLNFIAITTADVIKDLDSTINLLPKNLRVFAPTVSEFQARFYNEKDGFYGYDADPIWTRSVGPKILNKSFEEIRNITKQMMKQRILENDYDLVIVSNLQSVDPVYNVIKDIIKDENQTYTNLKLVNLGNGNFCLTCIHSMLIYSKDKALLDDFAYRLREFFVNEKHTEKLCKRSKLLYYNILDELRIADDPINCKEKSIIDVYQINYLINGTHGLSDTAKFSYIDVTLLSLIFIIYLVKSELHK